MSVARGLGAKSMAHILSLGSSGARPALHQRHRAGRRRPARGLGGRDLDADGDITVARLGEGHSNLTYAVQAGDRHWVRRPPAGPLLPTAHDVVREYRVLDLLVRAEAPVRVPRPVAVCEDADLIGAPFYLMEHVEGVVVRDTLPGWLDEPQRRHALGLDLATAFAEVHRVDVQPFVADGLGRPNGYLARAPRRWTGQREGIQAAVATAGGQARDLPDYDLVRDWLVAHLPDEAEPAVVHGDAKLDNVVVGPGETPRVAAVLDWEMATVGDPRADLGYLLSFWPEAGGDHPLAQLVTAGAGFPSRGVVAAWSRRPAGRPATSPGSSRSRSGSSPCCSRRRTTGTWPAAPTTRSSPPSSTVSLPCSPTPGRPAMPDLKALVVDWGGVLTEPLDVAIRAWAEIDGVDFEHYVAVMREWLGTQQGELARDNPVAALERGEIEVPHFEEQLAALVYAPTGMMAVGRKAVGHRAPVARTARVEVQSRRLSSDLLLTALGGGANLPLSPVATSGLTRADRRSAPAAAALLDLRPRHLGQFRAAFPGHLGQFRAALAGSLGQRGGAFTGHLGQFRAALHGHVSQFRAAFPGHVCQSASPLGADLQAVAHLFGDRAVTKRAARRGPGRQRGGDGRGHPLGSAAAAPAERRLALGVDGGDGQPGDQAHIGQERTAFVGLRCRPTSFQNVCPPRLPGTTLSASAADANRGSFPVASSSPPPTWTAPLMRATVSALDGTFARTGSGSFFRPSIVGAGRVGGGFGAAQGLHAPTDEDGRQHGTRNSSDQHGPWVPLRSTSQTRVARRLVAPLAQRQKEPEEGKGQHRAPAGDPGADRPTTRSKITVGTPARATPRSRSPAIA